MSTLCKNLSHLKKINLLADCVLILTTWFVVAVSLLVAASPARAQQLDINVRPSVTYAQVKPGETYRLAVSIDHAGTIPLVATPMLVDFDVHPETGAPELRESTNFQYARVLGNKAFNQAFVLNPNQDDQVVISFEIPETAQPKEHHLSLVFRLEPQNVFAGSGARSNVSAMVASNIILLVAHSEDDQSELEVKTLNTPWLVDSLGNITADASVLNTGPTATTVRGKLLIRNIAGKVVADFPLYPDIVLAQSSRPLRAATISPDLTDNPEEVKPTQFVFDPAFLLGPYRTELVLYSQDGEADDLVLAKNTTLALPLSLIGLILGAITLWILVRFSGNFLIVHPQ